MAQYKINPGTVSQLTNQPNLTNAAYVDVNSLSTQKAVLNTLSSQFVDTSLSVDSSQTNAAILRPMLNRHHKNWLGQLSPATGAQWTTPAGGNKRVYVVSLAPQYNTTTESGISNSYYQDFAGAYTGSAVETIILPTSGITIDDIYFPYPTRGSEALNVTLVITGYKGGNTIPYSAQFFSTSNVTFKSGVTFSAPSAGQAKIVKAEWLGNLIGWVIVDVYTVTLTHYWFTDAITPILMPVGITSTYATLESSTLTAFNTLPSVLRRDVRDRGGWMEVGYNSSNTSLSLYNAPYWTRFSPNGGGTAASGLTNQNARIPGAFSTADGKAYNYTPTNTSTYRSPVSAVGTVGGDTFVGGGGTAQPGKTFLHEYMHTVDAVLLDSGLISSDPTVIGVRAAGLGGNYGVGGGAGGVYNSDVREFTAEHLNVWVHQDYPAGSNWSDGVYGGTNARAVLDALIPAKYHV
jgi:hypothetical protein